MSTQFSHRIFVPTLFKQNKSCLTFHGKMRSNTSDLITNLKTTTMTKDLKYQISAAYCKLGGLLGPRRPSFNLSIRDFLLYII